MSTIEADHYRKERAALKQDPILIAMAEEMRDTFRRMSSTFVHQDGEPQGWFMSAVSGEYRARGGELGRSIGGPAKALLELLVP